MHHLLFPIIIVALLFLAIIAVGHLRTTNKRHRAGNHSYDRHALMSPAETEFYDLLSSSLPHLRIFPQVSLGALLKPSPWSQAAWNAIAQQRADYVVYEPTTCTILAVVELDDSTHRTKADRDATRDARLSSAGYRVVRWHLSRRPSRAEIAATFPRV